MDPATSLLDAVRDVTPFRGLVPGEAQRLRPHLRLHALAAGDVLATRGDPATRAFVLLEGDVALHRADGTSRPVEAGRLVGDLAALDERPWPFSLRAESPVTAVALERAGFEVFLHDPVLAWELVTSLVRGGRIGPSEPSPRTRQRNSPTWTALTPAERRIARLVADGLTNREVAQQLYVSPLTVQSHVRSILNKLGLRSRVALAVLVARAA